MSARTLWKGVIKLQSHEVPVKLYAAAKDHTVRFRLLHKKDRQPVKQRMINSETGKEVPKERRRKGAEVEPDHFVVLDPDELEALAPASSREIEVLRFVPRQVLEHEWYNRPYLLGPDEEDAAYWALAQAVDASGQEGIARWVMRRKRYVGSLTTHEGYLALTTIRFADEVVQPKELEGFPLANLDQRELQMAEQLMSLLETDFEPEKYRDEYHDSVVKLIETKAKGGKVTVKKPRRKARTDSLGDALQASLAEAKERRSA